MSRGRAGSRGPNAGFPASTRLSGRGAGPLGTPGKETGPDLYPLPPPLAPGLRPLLPFTHPALWSVYYIWGPLA